MTVHVLECNDPNLLRIEVHDTGIGIETEDLPKLFNVFGHLESNIREHKWSGPRIHNF